MASVLPIVVPTYSAGTPGFKFRSTGITVKLRGVNCQAHGILPGSLNMIPGLGGNLCRAVLYWDKAELASPTGSGTSWSTYTHTYDAAYIAKMDALINFCTGNGIMVLIDPHKVSALSSYFLKADGTAPGTAGIPAWYYTDSRFPGQQAGYSPDQTGKGAAQADFWTGDGDGASNGSHCNQVFWNAWISFLINRYGSNPLVILWGMMNEPPAGNLLSTMTYRAASTIINTWLTATRDHIIATDLVSGIYSGRGITATLVGGHLGWGDGDFSPFGNPAAMQAAFMVLEPHSYYRGLAPGSSASGASSYGFNAIDGAGNLNDYEYPDRSILTTVTADSTAGTQSGMNAFNEVFRAKGVALGLPMLWGEWGVQVADPGRIQYMSQMQTYFDAHNLSCTYWALRNSDQGSLSLLTGTNTYTDIAVNLQAWLGNAPKPTPTLRVVKDPSNRVRVLAAS